jgi:hypothetical protein
MNTMRMVRLLSFYRCTWTIPGAAALALLLESAGATIEYCTELFASPVVEMLEWLHCLLRAVVPFFIRMSILMFRTSRRDSTHAFSYAKTIELYFVRAKE